MYWIRRICVIMVCVLLVAAAGVVTVLRYGGRLTQQEQTRWPPIYIQTNPNSAAMMDSPVRETRYEELRPEQLAMILPKVRPYWMKAQGYTSFTWGEFGLSAYATTINLDLETRLPDCHIDLSARVITQDMLDMMSGVKEIEDPSVSVCHGVKFHIYEYEDTWVGDKIVLDARGYMNNCYCMFTMRVPKGDEALLQQAKGEFEQVLESFSSGCEAKELDWHSIIPRFSDEYSTRELTYEEAWTDSTFELYNWGILPNPDMKLPKITRSTFYKSDEMELVFTDGEYTVEWIFERFEPFFHEIQIPGQEDPDRSLLYDIKDLTEEMLQTHMANTPEQQIGVRFGNFVFWVKGHHRHASWIYAQITLLRDRIW